MTNEPALNCKSNCQKSSHTFVHQRGSRAHRLSNCFERWNKAPIKRSHLDKSKPADENWRNKRLVNILAKTDYISHVTSDLTALKKNKNKTKQNKPKSRFFQDQENDVSLTKSLGLYATWKFNSVVQGIFGCCSYTGAVSPLFSTGHSKKSNESDRGPTY